MKFRYISLIILLPMLAGLAKAQTGPSGRARAILVGDIRSASKSASKTVVVGRAEPKLPSTADSTEERAFELVNAQRLLKGLSPLEWDEKLVAVARLHSKNMAAGHFFNHRGLDGGMVDDRAAQFGILNWLAIGENIAFMKGYDDPATTAVEKWMKSPSHKQNILSPQWNESAIGVAVSDDGSVYFTQVFLTQ